MKRFKNIILIYDILYLILLLFLYFILELNNLDLLNNILFPLLGIFILGFIVGIYQLVLKIKKRTIKIIITILVTFLVVFSIPILIFIYAFTYQPEHIITINNTKYVAEVSSFLSVNVNYYEYKNHLVRGNKVLCSEYYGEGGYDPFTSKYSNEPTKRCFK